MSTKANQQQKNNGSPEIGPWGQNVSIEQLDHSQLKNVIQVEKKTDYILDSLQNSMSIIEQVTMPTIDKDYSKEQNNLKIFLFYKRLKSQVKPKSFELPTLISTKNVQTKKKGKSLQTNTEKFISTEQFAKEQFFTKKIGINTSEILNQKSDHSRNKSTSKKQPQTNFPELFVSNAPVGLNIIIGREVSAPVQYFKPSKVIRGARSLVQNNSNSNSIHDYSSVVNINNKEMYKGPPIKQYEINLESKEKDRYIPTLPRVIKDQYLKSKFYRRINETQELQQSLEAMMKEPVHRYNDKQNEILDHINLNFSKTSTQQESDSVLNRSLITKILKPKRSFDIEKHLSLKPSVYNQKLLKTQQSEVLLQKLDARLKSKVIFMHQVATQARRRAEENFA